jgi:hypothetical protein
MSWHLDGTYFESCNCDAVCPCTTSGLTAPADNERCGVTLAFHVERGEIDGVELTDRTIVLYADAPQVMAEGGWQIGVFVDDKATEAERDALVKVFAGHAGGPMAHLAPLFGEVLGVEQAPISFADEGRLHRVAVADRIDIEVEDGVAPQFGEHGPIMRLDGVFHPANSTVTVARATRATGRDVFGRAWDNAGKNAHSAPFSWSA